MIEIVILAALAQEGILFNNLKEDKDLHIFLASLKKSYAT